MIKKIVTVIIILLIVTAFILFLNRYFSNKNDNQRQELQKVKIGMGYIPNVQFAPFYVAEKKGYYRDQGLEVEFDYSKATDLIKLLGEGEYDFGIASGDEVILAADKDIPVKYVMTIYSKFPVAIVSLAVTEIKAPQDLVGKSIGLPGFYGSSYIGLKAFLYGQNIDENAVKMEAVGYTQVQSLTERKVDAAVVFSMNEPIQLQNLGYEINIIELSDYIDFVSAGIITSNAQIINQPKVVSAFITATAKGMEEIKRDPEGSFKLVAEYLQLEDEVKETQYDVLLKSIEFWKGPQIDKKMWEDTLMTLDSFQMLTQKKTTNDFLDSQFTQDLD